MSTKNRKTDLKFAASYDRGMLRSAFVSLFWAVITERKKRGIFTFQALAKLIGSTKHEVSRWFNGDPNWTLNTVSNIARALDVELIIQARDRTTGAVFSPAGLIATGYNVTDAMKPVTATTDPAPSRSTNVGEPRSYRLIA